MISELRIMPWALVYIRLMVRMPGGNKCRASVAQFVTREGLMFVGSRD